MDKIISYKVDYEKEFKRYLKAVANEDYVTACTIFYNIKDKIDEPRLFLHQAVVYSALKRPIHEIYCLFKLISYKNFSEFNIDYTAKVIALYYKQIQNIDVEQYYINLLKGRAKSSGQEITSKPKLLFADDLISKNKISAVNELIVSGKYAEVASLIENVKSDDASYERLKMLEAYSYKFLGENEKIKKVIDEVKTKKPSSVDTILNILNLYEDEKNEYSSLKDSLIETKKGANKELFIIDKLLSEKKYPEVLKKIYSLSPRERFSEKNLFSAIQSAYHIGDIGEVVKLLKISYIIDRNVFTKRYIRTLEQRMVLPVGDLYHNLNSIILPELTFELDEILGLKPEEFIKLDKSIISDVFDFTLTLKSPKNLGKLMKLMVLRDDCMAIVQDALLDPSLNDGIKYTIAVNLLSSVVKNKFYIVLKGKLFLLKPKYPSCLLDEFSYGDESNNFINISYFALAYAEAFVYLVYNDLDIKNIEKFGDKVYKKIMNLSPDKMEMVKELKVLSAVIASVAFVKNNEILDMISLDFELSRVSLRNILRMLELF